MIPTHRYMILSNHMRNLTPFELARIGGLLWLSVTHAPKYWVLAQWVAKLPYASIPTE
ncbi:MAG: hypothetical protein IJ234_04410 [Clostridia bacterium]|nr:hypothetical protein [Clostridia bacterium]